MNPGNRTVSCMNSTDTDPAARAEELLNAGAASTVVVNARKAEYDEAVRVRQQIIRDLADLTGPRGERLISNYKIAKYLGVSAQTVAKTLEPAPDDEEA
jgi:hypothetical protein